MGNDYQLVGESSHAKIWPSRLLVVRWSQKKMDGLRSRMKNCFARVSSAIRGVKNLAIKALLEFVKNVMMDKAPVVINETVLVTKEFLDDELAKYATWAECVNKSIKALFTGSKGDFKHCKQNGVGQTTILKFLGKNWKQWMVQEALDTIKRSNDGELDRVAVEELPNLAQAKV